mgnify:CR=1 FL=1
MIKKAYIPPEAEIETFTIASVITESNPNGGIGDGDNPGGEIEF